MEYLAYFIVSIIAGIVGSISAAALNFGMQEDMLLEKYRTFLSKLPKKLAKPLGLCPWCTAPHVAWIATSLYLFFVANAGLWSILIFSYLSILAAWAFLAFNYNTLIERYKEPTDIFLEFYDTFIRGWSVGAYPDADKEYIQGFLSTLSDLDKEQFFKAIRAISLTQPIKPSNYIDSKETNRDHNFVILDEVKPKPAKRCTGCSNKREHP